MPIGSCSSGVLATAVLTLLLLPPVHYYVPLWAGLPSPPTGAGAGAAKGDGVHGAPAPEAVRPFAFSWPALEAIYFPTLDLVFTFTLLLLGTFTYLCEWVQRKLMERRILKLNQHLGTCVERLHAWDAQQEHLEATLRMVQNATSEYNLLLYLLLRQRRCAANAAPAAAAAASPGARRRPPAPSDACFFDKGLEDDLSYLRSPIVDM